MVNMKRIKHRLGEFVAYFGKQYLKAYKTALVLHIRAKKQGNAADEQPDWHLMLDPNRLARNPRIEGDVFIGEGLKKKVHWVMGKNYVVTETPIAEEEQKDGAVAPASPDGASPPNSPKSPDGSATSGEGAAKGDPRVWLDDSCSEVCMNPQCGVKFGLLKRRTHCRQCGEIFCSECTKQKIEKDKFCAECYGERTAVGVDPSTLLPVLERPKIKVRMINFYKYKVALHDAELFANAGAADAAAKVKKVEGAEGKFLLVLTHRRATRPSMTIAFEKQEDRDQWKSLLQSAASFSPQPVTLDPVLRPAFINAYRRTRWYAWCWGSWELDGNEGELLSELIYDAMAREIFGAELAKLGETPRKLVRKAITTAITGAVSAMWAGLQKSVAAARAPLEAAAESLLGPLFEKERELQDKLQADLGAEVEKGLEKAEPTLQEKFGESFPIIAAAGEAELMLIASSLREWKQEVDAEAGKASVLGPWWKYGWVQWRGDWLYAFKSKPISEMIDVKLNDEDASPESRKLASDLKNDLVRLNQSAFVVLKDRMLAASPNGTEPEYVSIAAKEFADISRRAAHDVQIILKMRVEQALDATIRPPLEEVLAKVIEALCKPLEALIPSALADVLDPERMCNEIIDRLLREKIKSLVNRAITPTLGGVEAKGAQLAQEGM